MKLREEEYITLLKNLGLRANGPKGSFKGSSFCYVTPMRKFSYIEISWMGQIYKEPNPEAVVVRVEKLVAQQKVEELEALLSKNDRRVVGYDPAERTAQKQATFLQAYGTQKNPQLRNLRGRL